MATGIAYQMVAPLSSWSTSSSFTDEEKCERAVAAKSHLKGEHGVRFNCLVTRCPRAHEGGVDWFRILRTSLLLYDCTVHVVTQQVRAHACCVLYSHHHFDCRRLQCVWLKPKSKIETLVIVVLRPFVD